MEQHYEDPMDVHSHYLKMHPDIISYVARTETILSSFYAHVRVRVKWYSLQRLTNISVEYIGFTGNVKGL